MSSNLDDFWTPAYFRARLRREGLTPTSVPNVYRDSQGNLWHVDNPDLIETAAERRESFDKLICRRPRE